MREPPQSQGLRRVQYQLRAAGVPVDTSNALRAGIHTRGYLPHVKKEGAAYFVTFRTGDSLPQKVWLELCRRHGEHSDKEAAGDPNARHEAQIELQRAVERHLDKGLGSCPLRRPELAEVVARALQHFHGVQYLLDDWVVMPNHVHLILWPLPNFTLSDILRSRKRHTAREINRRLGRTGTSFWQPESYDHWIRDDVEKARIRRYIRSNPVKAGLCATPEAWQWSSAWQSRAG